MRRIDTAQLRAFPADIARVNFDLLKSLAASAAGNSQESIEVVFEGEGLRIPFRVYYDIGLVDAAVLVPGDAGVVAACLGSRHKDGYLRQRCIEAVLREPRAWSAPYVVEALDERPAQILQAIAGKIPDELLAAVSNFVTANEAHFLHLCRRCVSLWNEHYRYPGGGVHVTWSEYPGARVVAEIVAAARSTDPSFGVKNRGAIPNGGLLERLSAS
jgi:hypothetical protein